MAIMNARTAARAALATLLAAAAALLTAPAGHAAVTLTSGTLTDAHGIAAPGTVQIYAWSRSGSGAMPLIATAQTDLNGAFTAVAQDDQQLLDLAAAQNGWLDFLAIGTTAGHQGDWTFSLNVSGTAGAAITRSAHAATAATAPTTATPRAVGSLAPVIAIRATQTYAPPAGTSAHAASGGPGCSPVMTVLDKRTDRSLAIVGELNNAYNDGTVGTYTYGRSRSASTNFGVAVSYDGGGTFSIDGETHMGDSGSITFPAFKHRLARKLRSMFEFTRSRILTNTCARRPEIQIRATSWIGGDDESIKQAGALDACDPRAVQPFLTGSSFDRNRNSGVRFKAGVEAFGVNLTTQTDFDDNTALHYSFGRTKRHYLCGADGRQSPYESGRVFSGAR
jgi:hypothetical protein